MNRATQKRGSTGFQKAEIGNYAFLSLIFYFIFIYFHFRLIFFFFFFLFLFFFFLFERWERAADRKRQSNQTKRLRIRFPNHIGRERMCSWTEVGVTAVIVRR